MSWKTLSLAIFLLGILYVHAQTAKNFQAQCLKAHNKYRKMHGVPNLKTNEAVRKYAKKWANYLAKNNKFEHRKNGKYGENLYMSIGVTKADAAAAVKAWYDEIKLYNWTKPGFSMETGHFTQVVWKGSKQLGCAYTKKGNKIYVVANYNPPGNYLGQFGPNVPKKKK